MFEIIATRPGSYSPVEYGVEQLDNEKYMAVAYVYNYSREKRRLTINRAEYKTKAGAERVVYKHLREIGVIR